MTKTPDAWFEQVDEAMAPIALALRERVKVLAPDLNEGLAWNFPCYVGNERVFSIAAHAHHCNLQLWNGARLTGLSQRIEGSGKSLRHVKLRALSDLDEGLDRIILAAVELDQTDPQRVN